MSSPCRLNGSSWMSCRFGQWVRTAAREVLVSLLRLGWRPRRRMLARHATLAHLVASISSRLIVARRDLIPGRIGQALGELAAHVGADRAYAVFEEPLRRRYVWSRDGVACPPGWPEGALALAGHLRSSVDDVVHIRRTDRLPPGGGGEAFAVANVSSWACVSGHGCEMTVGILGFDRLQPSIMLRPDEFGLLRLAFDAIANAVGREHLERERSRLEDRLRQVRQMEVLGVQVSGIAHNFNNIVGVILGHTEMAEADRQPARHLPKIRQAGERARDLVDQILAQGRQRPAARRALKVSALIAEAVSMLRASLPRTIDVTVRQADDDAVVSGEAAQLQQVILNLCTNAAQAMGGIGPIDLDVTLQTVAAIRVLGHGALMPGRYVHIAVVDTGRGIEAEVLDQIFEPFFTLRRDGNGLGLATVREIVREHGGMIDVWSRPGVGSRFEVWLPCTTMIMRPGEARIAQSQMSDRAALSEAQMLQL